MDDIIVYGGLSIALIYAVAALVVAVIVIALVEFVGAFAAFQTGRAAGILAALLLVPVLYTGTGLWLQRRGRI